MLGNCWKGDLGSRIFLKITLWRCLLWLPAFRRDIPPQSWRFSANQKVSVNTNNAARRHITETRNLNIQMLPVYFIKYKISHIPSRNAQVAQSLQWTCCDMGDWRPSARNCTNHFHQVTSLECVKAYTPPVFNVWSSVTLVPNLLSNGIRTRDESTGMCSCSVSKLTHQ